MKCLKTLAIATVTAFALVFILWITAAHAQTATTPHGHTLAQISEATARINGNCSAQVIYSERDRISGKVETLLLTAKHCVADTKEGDTQTVEFLSVDDQLRPTGSLVFTADVKGRSFNSDVALLQLRERQIIFDNVVTIAAADRPVKFGEPTVTAGYPAAGSLTVTAGLLGQRERSKVSGSDHEYQRATSDIMGGSSGGALYLGGEGSYQLYGLTTAGIRGAPFYGLYTTVDDIREYLKVAAPQVLK